MSAPFESWQYSVLLDTYRELVERGFRPGAARELTLGAAQRALDVLQAGMGKMQPTRRLQRELDPTIPPRLVMAGEQCQHIQEVPGAEEALYGRLNELRNQGWNVIDVGESKGFSSLKTYYACPPGKVPMEAQPLVMQSPEW
jgi:hypothetical protein